MATVSWPHAHGAHAFVEYLKDKTRAEGRVTVQVPEARTYPLLTCAEAGYGTLGTDPEIQADELRLQVDAWALKRDVCLALASEVYASLDYALFPPVAYTTLSVADAASPSTSYEVKVERVWRSGGGEPYFDDLARCWRVTTFYNVKIGF